ncbi:hypothetical protein LXL04_006215 [Taraxacum kok-saghyz]
MRFSITCGYYLGTIDCYFQPSPLSAFCRSSLRATQMRQRDTERCELRKVVEATGRSCCETIFLGLWVMTYCLKLSRSNPYFLKLFPLFSPSSIASDLGDANTPPSATVIESDKEIS